MSLALVPHEIALSVGADEGLYENLVYELLDDPLAFRFSDYRNGRVVCVMPFDETMTEGLEDAEFNMWLYMSPQVRHEVEDYVARYNAGVCGFLRRLVVAMLVERWARGEDR